ncbi:MAG: DUF1080 domain-containing protein, partial [Bacteroidia bacterium]
GWPAKGYECQVLNSTIPGDYMEHKLSGSIYAVRNVWKAVQADKEWYNYTIKVQGKTIQTFINGMLAAEYTEPAELWRPEGWEGRKLSPTGGTFAFQCHDPGSVVAYKNIKVKPLADDLPTPGTPPEDLEFEAQIVKLASTTPYRPAPLSIHSGPHKCCPTIYAPYSHRGWWNSAPGIHSLWPASPPPGIRYEHTPPNWNSAGSSHPH